MGLVTLMSPYTFADGETIKNNSEHWYFQADISYSALYDACAQGYTSCEEESAGFGGQVGYQINPYFALQGGYRYMGQFERHQSTEKTSVNLSALELAAVGNYAIDQQWSLYTLAGVALGQSITTNSTVLNGSSSDGVNLSPIVGGGVRYRLNDNWQTYASLQFSPDIAGSTTDITTFGIGIRYELAPSKPQVIPQPIQKTQIRTQTVMPALSQNALFDFNKVTLTERSKNSISDVVARLTAYPTSQVKLLGFADNVGNKEVNLAISKRRVQSVADYLISQGVKPEQITQESFGDLDPSYPNNTAEGRAMNRRVRLVMDAIVR